MSTLDTYAAEMPSLESLLNREILNSQDGLRMLEDAITDVLIPYIEDWLCTRQYLEEAPDMQDCTLTACWRNQAFMQRHSNEAALQRDFQAHREAGGKREAWAPWEALGLPRLKPWLATKLGIRGGGGQGSQKRARAERRAPSLAREFARRIVYGDLTASGKTAGG